MFRVVWLLALLLAVLCDTVLCQNASEDNCAGSGAKVRHMILYNLRQPDADTLREFNLVFQQRLSECQSVLYPGSSYGGPAISTSPVVYGFPPSRPMPVSATIADWVGWMDFASVEGLRRCLQINNRTGTLQAMRAFSQPNGRFDLITRKVTLPGNKNEPCPFPDSYAPATVRYLWAYILPTGADKAADCKTGAGLWHRMLRASGYDVRHGTACSLLSNKEAASYGIQFNSGFGGYVDFLSLRGMTRHLGTNNQSIQGMRKQLRTLPLYVARGAIALPWSGRR